jgi:PAS domain S-box-containing protein
MTQNRERSGIDRLFALIEETPIATVITDPRSSDNPIVAANDAFCALTGYSLSEVLGRNCRFLNAGSTEPIQRAALRRAVTHTRPTLVALTNFRKDGSAFRNAVMIAPLLDEEGKIAWFVGSQMDVSNNLTPPMLPRPEAEVLLERLTRRHLQVLEFMIAGRRNKQIAEFLGISEKTVKMHRKALLTRLGAPTSADAIRIGVEAGLAISDGRS